MSRMSVFNSTETLPLLLTEPAMVGKLENLIAEMRSHPSFEFVSPVMSNLALLSKAPGSYKLRFQLNVAQANELGLSCERKIENGRITTHYSSNIYVRICTFENGQHLTDYVHCHLRMKVNDTFYQGVIESPIKITPHVKLNPDIQNVVVLNKPSMDSMLIVAIFLARAVDPAKIMRRMLEKRMRPASVTVEKLCKRGDSLINDDLAVTLTEVSLVCPLSQRRFQIPVLGQNCSHVACFDLATYLKMNRLTKKWMCPICNQKVLPSQLVVDEYLKNVLNSLTASNIDTSTILVTNRGEWSPKLHNTQAMDEETVID